MTTDVIKQIRRATRRRFTAEEKIRSMVGFRLFNGKAGTLLNRGDKQSRSNAGLQSASRGR